MPLQLIAPDEVFTVKDNELPEIQDGDQETTYTLRPISVDDHRRLQRQHTKDVIDRRSHVKVPQVDHDALNDAVLDYVLVGWSGILLKGAPVECVTAHKLLLDGQRRVALMTLAGMNKVERAPEVRADSFRQPA